MRKATWMIPLLIGSAAALAQDSSVTTLRIGTKVVAVSAVVRSKTGEPVGGMTRDDFILKQDGKEQPIRYFSQGSELPLTIALLVDTSGSQRTFIGDESLASDVFFETMLRRKEDRAMLVEFDRAVVKLQGLTTSASTLHLSLLGLRAHASTTGGTLLNDAIYETARDTLAHETGRKAMVILTDGGENGSSRSLSEAIEQAQRADVQIYSILYSAWGGFNAPTTADPGKAILRQLSESTGGRVFTVTAGNSLRDIYQQIGDDLRLQYEIGYTPPAETKANSFHKLEVKARDKKLSVQARTGFFAQP